MVYIGYAKEPVSYQTRLFVQKELDIMGSRNALPEDFCEVIRMLETGSFPVQDTISAVVPMNEAGGYWLNGVTLPAALLRSWLKSTEWECSYVARIFGVLSLLICAMVWTAVKDLARTDPN